MSMFQNLAKMINDKKTKKQSTAAAVVDITDDSNNNPKQPPSIKEAHRTFKKDRSANEHLVSDTPRRSATAPSSPKPTKAAAKPPAIKKEHAKAKAKGKMEKDTQRKRRHSESGSWDPAKKRKKQHAKRKAKRRTEIDADDDEDVEEADDDDEDEPDADALSCDEDLSYFTEESSPDISSDSSQREKRKLPQRHRRLPERLEARPVSKRELKEDKKFQAREAIREEIRSTQRAAAKTTNPKKAKKLERDVKRLRDKLKKLEKKKRSIFSDEEEEKDKEEAEEAVVQKKKQPLVSKDDLAKLAASLRRDGGSDATGLTDEQLRAQWAKERMATLDAELEQYKDEEEEGSSIEEEKKAVAPEKSTSSWKDMCAASERNLEVASTLIEQLTAAEARRTAETKEIIAMIQRSNADMLEIAKRGQVERVKHLQEKEARLAQMQSIIAEKQQERETMEEEKKGVLPFVIVNDSKNDESNGSIPNSQPRLEGNTMAEIDTMGSSPVLFDADGAATQL